jgi:hypothetical protein
MEEKAMKTLKVLTVLLALVLVFTAWAPAMAYTTSIASSQNQAAAGTSVNLTITNPTPKEITVTLTGKQKYTITVPKGATINKKLDAGQYKYSYKGCLNKPKKGNLKIQGGAATLKIAPCKMANWTFVNRDLSKPVTLKLKGWVSYSEYLGPGQTKTFAWVADTYDVSIAVCGKTYNETWKIKGNKAWEIYACK